LLLAPGFLLAHAADDPAHILEHHPAVQAIQQKKDHSLAATPLTKAPSLETPFMKLLVRVSPQEGLAVSALIYFEPRPPTPLILPLLRI
jgi:hypothetical protein